MAMTRRRFLTIGSAACLMAGAPAQAYRWQGIALGAKAQIVLDHPQAEGITRAAQSEIARLEKVFSLFDARSELMQLNRAGRIDAPSFDMLECLTLARRVHDVTAGRFDPTVQPLWQAMARAAVRGTPLTRAEAQAGRAAIGFDRVVFGSAAVRLDKGQGLTLNGIAQGYIADRVARLLQAEGIRDVLIDTGEMYALGDAPKLEQEQSQIQGQRQGQGQGQGQARVLAGWPVSIANVPGKRWLSGRALATSAYAGTQFAPGQGHILDPRLGSPVRPAAQVSVSAGSAAMADALSTALVLSETRAEAAQVLSFVKDAQLEAFIL